MDPEQDLESNYDDLDLLNIPTEEDEDSNELDRGDDVLEEDNDEEIAEEETTDDTDADVTEDESSEGEEEVSEESEEGDDEDEAPKENKIPLSRLNQVIAQRDENKDRIAWLEAQLEKTIDSRQAPEIKEVAPEVEFDFGEAEVKYANLILEGENGEAAKLRSSIRKEELKSFQKEIEASSVESARQTKAVLDERDFEALVSTLETKYPFFDSSHDEYNEEAVDMVNSLMSGYMSDGKTVSTAALQKAVKKLAPMFTATTEDVKSDGGTKKGPSDKSKGRATKARKAAVATIKGQPSKLKGTKGQQDLGDVEVGNLTEKQFAGLSLKELKALRGDQGFTSSVQL